jgi:hypothetical protein
VPQPRAVRWHGLLPARSHVRRLTMKAIESAAKIRTLVAAADAELRGREAIIRNRWAGKFMGRLGRIDGVIADHTCGLRVLVMIYALDGTKRVLNSDPRTRSYWPIRDVEVQ